MDNSNPPGPSVFGQAGLKKGGLGALRILLAACLTSLVLDGLVCFLPTSDYQRWQLTKEHWYSHLLWCFERIHFDPTPIDIAITGSSKTFYGIDPVRLEHKLTEIGAPAHVANLSKPGAGRNAEWAVVQELLAVRKPKLLVVGIEDRPYPWGHPGFKDIASVRDVIAPPAALLHDYFADLVTLPERQVRLFVARYLPGLSGLNLEFDSKRYDETPLPWLAREWVDDLILTDRNAVQPVGTLVAERKPLEAPTALDKLLLKCCNDGDDKVYLRAIAALANAKGVRLLFVHVPMYEGAKTAEEADFVREFAPLIDGAAVEDLRTDASGFENWRHFNRIGAERLTDRLATIVFDMKIVALNDQTQN